MPEMPQRVWCRAPWVTAALLTVAPAALAGGRLYPAMPPPFVTWFEAGRPRAVIIAKSADLNPQPAAVLNRWLARITGASLPVRSTPAATDRDTPVVWLGGNGAWKRLNTAPAALKLGPEGYVIRTVGRDLVIAGATELGTLFGVAAFLERKLDCRWFWEGETGRVFPKRPTLRVGRIDETSRPAFRVRWVGRNPEWCAFSRLNVGLRRPDDFRIKWFVHTWLRLVPPSEYWKSHPEYYARSDGSRRDPTVRHAQVNLCTTNPNTARIAADTIDRIIRAEPGTCMISVDPMDTQEFCRCPDCRRLYDADAPYERRASRLVFDFTRRVAELVGKKHPSLFIKTIAYHTYLAPPSESDFRLPDNVVVQYCRFMCHNHSLQDPACPENRYFNRFLADWTRTARHVMLYEYYYKASWCELPWPIVHTLRRDIPYLHRLGIMGLATQWCDNPAANGLDFYVAAKLLWDPTTDVDALLDDFYEKAYGRAAAPMKRFHERLESHAVRSGLHLANQRPYQPMLAFLTPDFLADQDADLRQAEAAVRTPRAATRVRLMRTNWRYCQLLRDYLAAVDTPLANRPRTRWRAVLPEAVLTRVETLAGPLAKRLLAFISNPANAPAVPSPEGGYLKLLLSPRKVADDWDYPGDRAPTEVVLDKPTWLRTRAALGVPHPGRLGALWIYGYDIDWIKGTGAEHIVYIQTGNGRRLKVGTIGRPDRAGDGRVLCFILRRVPVDFRTSRSLRVIIENPAGGPYASSVFAVYLMPDEPVGEDEAGRLIETRPESVRETAWAFAEYGYRGGPSNEGSPLEVVLDLPRQEGE
ncbi:MAG: DUF4838 domain-containing protein [Kiritimatiellaeota bacterium]|nr:DUF4838 domain-containing protein [Kiritimatiellota bacterium]